jgi:LuxR family maltose regulon positive regulatory protein
VTTPRDAAPAPGAVDPKLQPPPVRGDVVARERLIRRLLVPGDSLVVTIIAPAGYGKTTLLAQWGARETRPVAWVTVDAMDADPHALFEAIATSTHRAVGLPGEILDLFGHGGASTLSTAVPRLASALHALPDPLILMLDDLHRIGRSSSIDALGALIAYQPPHVTVAVGSRDDAGLPVARLRAAGRLLELTEADLALDETESLDAIGRLDRSIGRAEGREIHRLTEGWPAAIYLATRAQRARRTTGADEDSADPPRIRRSVGAYLDDELLAGKDGGTRDFLVQTAILERMTGGLCDAVVLGTGSGERLHRLSATHHLVTPLDNEGHWYRYHTLMRTHLLELLERESAEVDRTVLHHRAADWLSAHDMEAAAIDHLFAAGDRDGAARLISAAALTTYRDGRAATVDRWLEQLDDVQLRRHPDVAAVAALTNLLQGHHRIVDRLAGLMARATYAAERTPEAEWYEAAGATIRALMARDGLAAAVEDAREAARRDAGPWRPIAMVVLGAILAASGAVDEADRVLEDAAEVAASQGADRARTTALAQRALIASERDEWVAAGSLAEQAVASADRTGARHDVTNALAAVAAARIAVRRGRVVDARRHLANLQAMSTTLSVAAPWLSVRILIEATRAHLALSDPAGARTTLRHAEDIVGERPDLGGVAAEVATMRQRIRSLPPGPGGASTLTAAEIRVLQLLPTYLSVPEIAARLVVSSNTIRTQVQSIYGKLGATSRAEAVGRAVEFGLLEPLPILAPEGFTTS